MGSDLGVKLANRLRRVKSRVANSLSIRACLSRPLIAHGHKFLYFKTSERVSLKQKRTYESRKRSKLIARLLFFRVDFFLAIVDFFARAGEV